MSDTLYFPLSETVRVEVHFLDEERMHVNLQFFLPGTDDEDPIWVDHNPNEGPDVYRICLLLSEMEPFLAAMARVRTYLLLK